MGTSFLNLQRRILSPSRLIRDFGADKPSTTCWSGCISVQALPLLAGNPCSSATAAGQCRSFGNHSWRLFQKTIIILIKNQWQSSLGSAPAKLWLLGQASLNRYWPCSKVKNALMLCKFLIVTSFLQHLFCMWNEFLPSWSSLELITDQSSTHSFAQSCEHSLVSEFAIDPLAGWTWPPALFSLQDLVCVAEIGARHLFLLFKGSRAPIFAWTWAIITIDISMLLSLLLALQTWNSHWNLRIVIWPFIGWRAQKQSFWLGWLALNALEPKHWSCQWLATPAEPELQYHCHCQGQGLTVPWPAPDTTWSCRSPGYFWIQNVKLMWKIAENN